MGWILQRFSVRPGVGLFRTVTRLIRLGANRRVKSFHRTTFGSKFTEIDLRPGRSTPSFFTATWNRVRSFNWLRPGAYSLCDIQISNSCFMVHFNVLTTGHLLPKGASIFISLVRFDFRNIGVWIHSVCSFRRTKSFQFSGVSRLSVS